MSRRLLHLGAAAALALAGSACGGGDSDDAADTGSSTSSSVADPGADDLSGEVVVFAARSLTESFDEIEAAFEEAHPDVDIVISFDGSSALAERIVQEGGADVFASADETNMQKVADADEIRSESAVFARNLLAIAVPTGNPGAVEGLDDFAADDLLIGMCAEEVPCGKYGREVLANAGVTPSIDTNEPDVRSLLTKVEAGELDAGIVYVTDVDAAGDSVESIEIPEEENVLAAYPVAALTNGENPRVADALIEFILSQAGQGILASYGFLAP